MRLITSAKAVMFNLAFACLFVCLSVSLITTPHKNYLLDIHENFSKDVPLDMEDVVKF